MGDLRQCLYQCQCIDKRATRGTRAVRVKAFTNHHGKLYERRE